MRTCCHADATRSQPFPISDLGQGHGLGAVRNRIDGNGGRIPPRGRRRACGADRHSLLPPETDRLLYSAVLSTRSRTPRQASPGPTSRPSTAPEALLAPHGAVTPLRDATGAPVIGFGTGRQPRGVLRQGADASLPDLSHRDAASTGLAPDSPNSRMAVHCGDFHVSRIGLISEEDRQWLCCYRLAARRQSWPPTPSPGAPGLASACKVTDHIGRRGCVIAKTHQIGIKYPRCRTGPGIQKAKCQRERAYGRAPPLDCCHSFGSSMISRKVRLDNPPHCGRAGNASNC